MPYYKRWSNLRLIFTETIDLIECNAQWDLKSKEIKVLRDRSILSKIYSVLHELCHVGIDLLFGMNRFGLCSIRCGYIRYLFHNRLDRINVIVRYPSLRLLYSLENRKG